MAKLRNHHESYERRMLEDYTSLFASAMRALESRSVLFEPLARQVLADVIGGSSYEALMVMIGKESFRDPGVFAEQLARVLGSGAVVLFSLIEEKAAKKLDFAHDLPEIVEFEALTRPVSGTDQVGRLRS